MSSDPAHAAPAKPRRRWWRRTTIGAALLVAALAAGWAWQHQRAAAAGTRRGTPRTQAVSVQPVQRQTVHVSVRTIGTFTASNTAVVHAQISGVLQALHFREGEPVQAGQTLAQIDPRAFEANLAAAQGTQARDQAQLDNARFDLTRYRDLLVKDAIAKQQVDTQAALVHQLEGTVQADAAAVATARLQLSYTRVSAPIAGRAGLKQVDLGNVVQQTDANGIVTIAQTRPIALVFAVPARHAAEIMDKLHAGTPLEVEAWDAAGTHRLAVGRVATMDNAIDPTTDTLKLKALFDNRDDRLFPNQAVSVHLQLHSDDNALTVPTAALQRGAQGFLVYAVDAQQQVHVRVVQPGAVDGDRTAVTGPLQPGEPVVTDGLDRLRDGAKVDVIAPPAAADAASAPASHRRHRGAAS